MTGAPPDAETWLSARQIKEAFIALTYLNNLQAAEDFCFPATGEWQWMAPFVCETTGYQPVGCLQLHPQLLLSIDDGARCNAGEGVTFPAWFKVHSPPAHSGGCETSCCRAATYDDGVAHAEVPTSSVRSIAFRLPSGS